MATLTIEIPDSLLSKLKLTGQPMQNIVLRALEQYVDIAQAEIHRQTQAEILAEIRQRRSQRLADFRMLDSTAMIQEDRNR